MGFCKVIGKYIRYLNFIIKDDKGKICWKKNNRNELRSILLIYWMIIEVWCNDLLFFRGKDDYSLVIFWVSF